MLRILSLAGGGARGLLSIQAIKYLEARTGRQVHQLFDFVAGTSTGALQAIALTMPQPLSGAALERAYLDMLPAIFDRRFLALGGLTGPLYPKEPLEHALQQTLGHTPLGYCTVPTAVATYSLTTRQPVMLGSYNEHATLPAWEAARASSAAPTFFEPHREFVDGGLCANSPSLWATLEAARHAGVPPEDCAVLHIGTGSSEAPIDPDKARGWGKLSWISPALSICMDGSEDLADIQMRELVRPGAYLRLQLPLSGQPGTANPAMDDVSPTNLLALRQAGQQMVAQQQPELDKFLAHITE